MVRHARTVRGTATSCGVTLDPASVDALRDRTIEAFGGVHVLCNNAGIGAGAEGRMWEHELNDWKWAIAVNVMPGEYPVGGPLELTAKDSGTPDAL